MPDGSVYSNIHVETHSMFWDGGGERMRFKLKGYARSKQALCCQLKLNKTNLNIRMWQYVWPKDHPKKRKLRRSSADFCEQNKSWHSADFFWKSLSSFMSSVKYLLRLLKGTKRHRRWHYIYFWTYWLYCLSDNPTNSKKFRYRVPSFIQKKISK